MEAWGYYNGRIEPLETMMVPMNDRVSYFGDGVYEAAMARNGKIFALEDHLDRFYNSAGLLRIQISQSREELTHALNDMVAKMSCSDVFLYWQATRGTGSRQHQFLTNGSTANIWITVKAGNTGDPDHKLKLITYEDTRFLHCNIKSLNLLPNVMAAQAAVETGCDEAVFHRGEIVTECAHSNVSIIRNGIFKTHPTDHYILPGITRAHLIQVCKKHGIPVDETPFTLKELREADEIIVSSTTKLVGPACELDGQPVGGKAPELVKLIQDTYLDRFYKETDGCGLVIFPTV